MICHNFFFWSRMTAVIDPLMTTDEVAALLRKRPRTVDSWREPGSTVALPFVRIAGQPRYRKADVQKFIDECVCGAAPVGTSK
jgi:Helix-turn-helix domain